MRVIGIGLMVWLMLATAAWAQGVSYRLAYSGTMPEMLEVTACFAAPEGQTRVRLGPPSGFVAHAEWEEPPLVALRAVDDTGAEHLVTREGERRWRVDGAASRLCLSYRLYDTHAPLTTDYRAYTRPLLTRNYALLIGYEALLFPDPAFSREPIDIELELSAQALPAGWRVHGRNGSGADAYRERAHERLSDWLAQAWAIGAWTRRVTPGAPDVLALPGQDTERTAREAAALSAAAAKRLGVAAGLLRLIVLLPVERGKASLPPLSAVHLPEGVVMAVTKDADAARLPALAHEIAHVFTATAVAEEGGEELAWWREGLAEFYARELPVSAGLWTRAQADEAWRAVARFAAENPYRERTLTELATQSWRDMAAHHVPYERGALVLRAVDRAAMAQGGLDAVLRARAGMAPLATTAEVWTWLTRFIPAEQAESLARALETGRRLAP